MKRSIELGKSADGQTVVVDYTNTSVEYHLLETPHLLDLVKEVLPTVVLGDEVQVIIERDLGRVIGTTNLVETTDDDEIIYAKRLGRDTYSRFVKHRQPLPCRSIVVVFRKDENRYRLWTAMCGKLLPTEAYQQGSRFNATHAMAYDERLIQIDTVTDANQMG